MQSLFRLQLSSPSSSRLLHGSTPQAMRQGLHGSACPTGQFSWSLAGLQPEPGPGVAHRDFMRHRHLLRHSRPLMSARTHEHTDTHPRTCAAAYPDPASTAP